MIRQYISLSFLGELKRNIVLNKFKRNWRKLNKNNYTYARNLFPSEVVEVGDYSYGDLNVITFSKEKKLKIGRFVSIASNVNFLLDAEHSTNHISTYPFKNKILNMTNPEAFGKGDIVVDDDVWFGYGATVISGVHIGQGAVIAANSLVTKDVPPYAIVGGVPATIIKYRFSKEIIDELIKINYKDFDEKKIREHIDELYEKIEEKEQLEWILKNKNI